jgi:hypothetical protein
MPSLERIQEKARRNYWTFLKKIEAKLNASHSRSEGVCELFRDWIAKNAANTGVSAPSMQGR